MESMVSKAKNERGFLKVQIMPVRRKKRKPGFVRDALVLLSFGDECFSTSSVLEERGRKGL